MWNQCQYTRFSGILSFFFLFFFPFFFCFWLYQCRDPSWSHLNHFVPKYFSQPQSIKKYHKCPILHRKKKKKVFKGIVPSFKHSVCFLFFFLIDKKKMLWFAVSRCYHECWEAQGSTRPEQRLSSGQNCTIIRTRHPSLRFSVSIQYTRKSEVLSFGLFRSKRGGGEACSCRVVFREVGAGGGRGKGLRWL